MLCSKLKGFSAAGGVPQGWSQTKLCTGEVLDDPASDVVDDHWLHPCECVPLQELEAEVGPVFGITLMSSPSNSG